MNIVNGNLKPVPKLFKDLGEGAVFSVIGPCSEFVYMKASSGNQSKYFSGHDPSHVCDLTAFNLHTGLPAAIKDDREVVELFATMTVHR